VETPIGKRLRTPPRLLAAGIVAITVLSADFLLVWNDHYSYSGVRTVLPIVALAAYLILAGGDVASVGLALRPIQGYRYWIKPTLFIGLVVGSIVLAVTAVFVVLGITLPIHGLPLSLVSPTFIRMCVLAPIVEEATYRLALCTGAVVLLNARWTIVLSGIAFALLHVAYGNPGPDNLVAGFFLAWAFLKSGTILVPVALHALGNLCVLVTWVGLWYWRSGALF
jgi:uncharacterized protein